MSKYEYEASGEAVCEQCSHAIQVRGPDDSAIGTTMTVEAKENIPDSGDVSIDGWFEHDCVFSEYRPYNESQTVAIATPTQ